MVALTEVHTHAIPSLNVLTRKKEPKSAEVWIHLDRQHDIDWKNIFQQIRAWITARESMRLANADTEYMQTRTVDELIETIEEAERIGAEFSEPALQKELMDVLFFIVSQAICQNLLDVSDVHLFKHQANGQGLNDSALEKMIEIAGNMDRKNPKKDLMRVFAQWISVANHGMLTAHPEVVLPGVLTKNGSYDSGNYPSRYFSAYHPHQKRVLNIEEFRQQLIYVRQALRRVRVAVGNPLEGLTRKHLQPVDHLIKDFTLGEAGIQEIERILLLNKPGITQEVLRVYDLNITDPSASFQRAERGRTLH